MSDLIFETPQPSARAEPSHGIDHYYLDYLLRWGAKCILGRIPSDIRNIRTKAGEYKSAFPLFSQYGARAAAPANSATIVSMATYLLFIYGWFALDRGTGIQLKDRKGFFDLMLEVDRIGSAHAKLLLGNLEWSHRYHEFHIEEAGVFIQHQSYDEALVSLQKVVARVRNDVPDPELRAEIISKLGGLYWRLGLRRRSVALMACGIYWRIIASVSGRGAAASEAPAVAEEAPAET